MTETTIIGEGKWLNLVSKKEGDKAWEFVTRKNKQSASIAVAFDKEERLILIKQFRPAVGGLVLEFPAGLIDSGETAIQAAVRELKEETGHVLNFHMDKDVLLGPVLSSAGLSDEELYVITGVSKLQKEQYEDIELVYVKPENLMTLIENEEKLGTKISSRVLFFALGASGLF